jgi:ribosome biogenesis GTPase
VEKRRTTLSRPDPFRAHREHILVANIDAALVVASVRDPHLTPRVIDRFMVAVESRGRTPGLVLNKTDHDTEGPWQSVADVYRALDYPVFGVSADEGIGIEGVREFLRDNTTCLLGHSGVGKSSLANALDPSLALRVGDISEASGKGRHTTTAVSLLPLPWGGYLVDTPGIREFGLWKMKREDLAVWFRELAPHIDECRFNDCLHRAEPQCAVKAALGQGEIVDWRYDSYLRILESLESPD